VSGIALLMLALVAFVGSHFVLSHPLRAPLVRALGAGGFAGVYSLVAAATLGWAVFEWRRAPVDVVWTAPTWAWPLGGVVMLIAMILFVGSVTAPNPALMGTPASATAAAPRGVQRITRHPMMWAFALWAVVHAALGGTSRDIALSTAILVLALVGARLQDGKKRGQLGSAWAAHEGATSFVPFGRGFAMPGWTALIGGIVLFAVATFAHPYAGGPNLWGMA
jgi:uncharacterized membrane protein